MRSIVSIANGGRPVLLFGQCGSMISTNTFQGTTRSISSRNSRLRVFFVDRFSPRLACFMPHMLVARAVLGNACQPGVLQTFPNPSVKGNCLRRPPYFER